MEKKGAMDIKDERAAGLSYVACRVVAAAGHVRKVVGSVWVCRKGGVMSVIQCYGFSKKRETYIHICNVPPRALS